MNKDQMLSRRGVLLVGAAVLGAAGAAGTARLLGADPAPPPGRPSVTPAAGAQQGSRTLRSSAYRLQPLAGHGPARLTPGRTLVRQEPFLRIVGRGRSMVLTFDDGPDPRYTPEVLRTLRAHDVRAMFFVCGSMVVDNKDMLREMAEEGHVVGNHTWSHPLLTQLTRSAVRFEMERTSEVIEEAYGERPGWFRAPYGAWNRAVFELGAELGMEPLAWTLDTLDWTAPGARTIERRVMRGAAPGVVVLAHDAGGDRSESVRALRDYLPRLLDSGYHITVPRRQFT
ncbi:polysaccharide deacetylase family protein [Streptomyces sp. HC44]|uniref:Polysaccharide deacetylase family protein n=1 Tax=Streptomyces scabichelini TaxID=2711217 RepID=A0A6G4VJ76_9ACTN|nr:polysaccharide deacetylase family protein [Streptomyces scabichelini]NGO13860.1 polysaccharide deacetylase family protein [Streptomyces scabichelini]